MSHIKAATENLIEFLKKEVGFKKSTSVIEDDEKDEYGSVTIKLHFEEGSKDKENRAQDVDDWQGDIDEVLFKIGILDPGKSSFVIGNTLIFHLPYRFINLAVILHPPHNKKEEKEVEEAIDDPKMTKEAEDFIKAKIAELIHEGKEQKQAEAIAYEEARKKGFKVPENTNK